ncbi:MAG: hypothetical protein FWD31_03085 [Planctomycetaceae bacterium]|nr:hypothetical protein [Planctomycetaceae bacterium]
MKNLTNIFFALAFLALCSVQYLMGATDVDYVMSVARSNTEPVVGRHHPGSADNDCGYENGHVIKIDGTYHMLMTELFNYKPQPHLLGWVPARVGYWTSKDGDNWQRVCTIVQGTATGSPDDYKDPKNNTWSSSWFWNEAENRWNIFWRGSWVWRYRSETEGPDGFAGPYSEAAKIYPPLEGEIPYWDNNHLASFGNVYTAEDGKYYSFIGVGDFRNRDDIQWVNGLAWADNIDGPWTRVDTDGHHPTFVYSENPFVNIYEINGRKVYFCVYDDLSSQHSLGYGYSLDGVHWTGKTLDLTGHTYWASNDSFVASVRTPCGLIKEDDGTYTIIFTALSPAPTFHRLYAQIGRVNVTIEEVEKPPVDHVVFPGDMNHWKVVHGDCAVQYGREYSLGFKDNGCDSVYVAETYSDVTVEAVLRYVDETWDLASARAGVYARKTDLQEENGYHAYLTAKSTVQLYAGDKLLRETWIGKRPGIFRKLKLSVNGNNIKVYYDGMNVPCIDINDDTYPGEGSVGLKTYRSHWHYEKVEIIKH